MTSSEIHINFNADSRRLHADRRRFEYLRESVLLRQGFGELSPEALAKGDALDLRKSAFKICFLLIIIIFLTSCAVHHTNFMQSINFKTLKDGTYIGQDLALLCNVKLATTIKDGKITDIKILSHYVTYPLAGRAYDIIPKRIVEKQSLDVDAVTAATISSNNIKMAVFRALEKAVTLKH